MGQVRVTDIEIHTTLKRRDNLEDLSIDGKSIF
jgi:hypothetical protein